MAPGLFSNMIPAKSKYIQAIFTHCREAGWFNVWFFTDTFILIAGGVSNVALLWLFLRDRKSLSASKVLGVNVVAMDLIYLSMIPVNLIFESKERVNRSISDFSPTSWKDPTSSDLLDDARDVFSMFNLIGCPLLLACMCIERYLAVMRPVLYLRMRKWEYRMAVSAVVWGVTLSFCLATGLLQEITIIMIPVSIIVSCLFILMLTCLGGVVWSLLQKSPAHTKYGNAARLESPQKRRAAANVVVVVVPAVISYLPVLFIIPLVLYIYYGKASLNQAMCDAFESCVLFPKFGVLIGPMFYLSKARQMCCLS